MKNFKRVINPCTNEVYIYNDKERPVNSFCKIEYQDGQLSITGVIGPKSNGDPWGSCGQCGLLICYKNFVTYGMNGI